jgi:internalin A
MNSPKSIRIQTTLDRDSHEYSELFSNRRTLIRLSVGTKKENASPLNLGYLSELLRNKSGEFQELKELFLWNIQGLTSLSNFPKLSVLDIRNAPDLEQVTIPAQIERLILENCPNLTTILIDGGQEQKLDKLWELSLAGSSAMPEQAVHALLKKVIRLRSLDVSNCTNLQNLGDALPSTIERLRARDCTSLETVRWPRRVGFADFYGCKSLNKLNSTCPSTLGYLDLTFCRSLTGLGSIQEVLREQELKSLFLYGSGIMNPPFSEHGSQIGDNVAHNTREFFEELTKSGTGQSKRCKLLLLGNGYAGKTELAHRVRNIPRFDHSSTHGIQLCTIDNYERHVTENRSVQLNIWDFAGQDLYHSTHRLFVSTGSIFIIVWDPEADLTQADNPREGVTNFPIRYWLDYLNTIAPGFHPIRAIVCNHKQNGRTAPGTLDPEEWCEQQKSKLKAQIGDDYFKELEENKIGFFCVDLKLANEVQLDELYRWIGSSISKVIDEQGTQIPLYWQYGHEMVRPWISKAPSRTMGLSEFQKKLQMDIPLRIKKAQDDPNAIEDPQILSKHWNGGSFIDEKRTKRVLRYLTRTGYLYWDEKLHNEDIIIDQPWALDRVYKLLERTPKQGGQSVGTFQQALLRQNGCFDDSFLENVVSDPTAALDEDQLQGLNKNLLLSFMISTGVCFPKRKYWQIGNQGQEYISPWHLPDSNAVVTKLISSKFAPKECSLDTIKDSAQLHAGHWHALMRLIAEKHGDEATFYKRAIYITGTDWSVDASKGQSRREWRALIEYEPVEYGPDGRVKQNGRIIYRSVVPNEGIDTRLKELIQSQLPGYFKNPSDAATAYEVQKAHNKGKPKVFVSYAWDKETSTVEYARIVDELEREIQNLGIVTLVRDRNENRKGASLRQFMDQIQTCDFAIVVLSDKYLTSWYCMYELMRLYQSFESSSRFEKDVVFICHPSLPKPSGIQSGNTPYSIAGKKWSNCQRILEGYQARPKARIKKADKDLCDVDLGINTVDGWHKFPKAYGYYLDRLPGILQKLQLRIDLQYKNKRTGTLNPQSIKEAVEKTIDQFKKLQHNPDA